jgi:hypothetical protein
MASDDFRASHITTGSVLRSSETDYWLCVSPACDLEPRASGTVLVQLVRLKPESTAKSYRTGEHVVIAIDGGFTILRALNDVTRQPSLETVVLPYGTNVTRQGGGPATLSGLFAEALSVGVNGAGDPVSEPAVASAAPAEPTVFTVVAQLRAAFATRFLLAAGQHLSRIGLDYIDR